MQTVKSRTLYLLHLSKDLKLTALISRNLPGAYACRHILLVLMHHYTKFAIVPSGILPPARYTILIMAKVNPDGCAVFASTTYFSYTSRGS